jgi:hypothetical protein
MLTPSPTPFVLSRDKIKGEISPSIDFAQKDFTPPSSPPQMQDSITVLMVEDEMKNEKWGWWQGYRKDRGALGFEASTGKNAVSMVKKGPRKKRKEDD